MCYLVLLASGRAAARLASDFRVLAGAGGGLRPLTLVLQVPLLACWLLVRPVSLLAFSACCALAPRLQLREPPA